MDAVKTSENSMNGFQHKLPHSELTYTEYLRLDELLSSQILRSVEFNRPAHHEHLFIITHQAYELWFKQILHELDSVMEIFKRFKERGKNQYELIKRFDRISLILKLCIDQFAILETMTSTDFLEFRNFLSPASGFQSLQFRLIEIKLGLKMDNRIARQKEYLKQFWSQKKGMKALEKTENEPTLFNLIEKWLESFPWNIVNYDRFQNAFKTSTNAILKEEYEKLKTGNNSVNKLENLKKRETLFASLFDEDSSRVTCNETNYRQMSRKAVLGAIMISIYNAEPEFGSSYHIINLIHDIDLSLLKWRYCHMLLVQKMIGIQNAGTGGSSGYTYLQSTICDEYQIFIDLARIPIFLIPPTLLPPLSDLKIENTE